MKEWRDSLLSSQRAKGRQRYMLFMLLNAVSDSGLLRLLFLCRFWWGVHFFWGDSVRSE